MQKTHFELCKASSAGGSEGQHKVDEHLRQRRQGLRRGVGFLQPVDVELAGEHRELNRVDESHKVVTTTCC